ncbi:MAG: mannitol dehydrogenase family protein [Geminicoccaceae bacterium]
MTPGILQFGTGRLLQAHADLMIGEALARGEAVGPIAAVQTTGSEAAKRRAAALAAGGGFPVRIRGLENGSPVDREVRVTSVVAAYGAAEDWDEIEALVRGPITTILSNTADRGYELDPSDRASDRVPRSFPAKLLKLLQARWRSGGSPPQIFPLELVSNNGEVLKGIVTGLATDWGLEPEFRRWLGEDCFWASSLIDRIVSESLDPVGAVAEPYALWAIQDQPGLQPPCQHADVMVTPDLTRYERLKLFILNLGHTWLAERWLIEHRPRDLTVRVALEDPALSAGLDALYDEEVLPVLAALGLGVEASAYRTTTLGRFKNPYLVHRLADIAQNHAAKKARRMAPVVGYAEQLLPGLRQPKLREALASTAGLG